jgi:redox-sensing transcriptional repressor
VFDNDFAKIGNPIGDLAVQPMQELAATIAELRIDMAILAVPAENAQKVAEDLVACGVHAILNYAPINLLLPPEVHVAYIDPVARMQSISYYL